MLFFCKLSFLYFDYIKLKGRDKLKEPRLFKLDERLMSCAEFVRENSKIADVGTDHAYLPIYLIKTGKIQHAIASDIRKGPLLNAEKNLDKYHLLDKVDLRLSDGLEKIKKEEVDDIIIAGMGGEIIVNILSKVDWIKDINKRLILQPMSMEEKVRKFLYKEKFKIIGEKITISENKIYNVMCAEFCGKDYEITELYPYIGFLENNLTEETKIYINKKINSLKNQSKGLMKEKDLSSYEKINSIIKKLENLI